MYVFWKGGGVNKNNTEPFLNTGMKWVDEILFLGVYFRHDLSDNVKNYNLKIVEIENLMKRWEYKKMSEFGRLIVIKTLGLSKLSHIAIVLPGLDDGTIRRLESKLIKFVWGGGRVKMALSAAKCKCIEGGMGAFDIKASWSAFKIKWLGKIFKDKDKDYSKIVQFHIYRVNNRLEISDLGIWTFDNLNYLALNIESEFWKQVLKCFAKGLKIYIEKVKYPILMVSIWGNPFFKSGARTLIAPDEYSRKHLCFTTLYINSMAGNDIVYLSYDEFCERHNARNHISLRFYTKIVKVIKGGLQKLGLSNISNISNQPFRPTMLEFALKQDKGCSFWAELLKENSRNHNNIRFRENKWEQQFQMQRGDIEWRSIYKLNMSIKFGNEYRFFHLQIYRDNLDTKTHSIHFRDQDALCTFCATHLETVKHLLFDCMIVLTLYREILNNLTVLYPKRDEINLNAFQFLLGEYDSKSDREDFIMVINMMRFVWVCKCTGMQLSLDNFKNFFGRFCKIQQKANILRCIQNIQLDSIWT